MESIKTEISLPKPIQDAIIKSVYDTAAKAQESMLQIDVPLYLDKKQTCKYLGISNHTLNDWLADDLIPFKRVGKVYRFNRTELDKFMASK